MTSKELGDAVTSLRAGQQKILERIAVIETKLGFGGRAFGYIMYIAAAFAGGIGGAMAITYWPWA